MADYGACPSVPVPVMEMLLGASSEHRPMLLLLPPCLAALASIKATCSASNHNLCLTP